jgi:cell division protein FtsA
VEDIAVSGRIPPNRDVLEVVPLEYALDGQAGIKDPLGMSGARLEIRANVISALTPNCDNLKKATAAADVEASRLIPSVVAAAKAVLSERQKENGVAVVDLGGTTTSVAVYEEGDLQYVGVVPAGANNITNDLAIVLAIDPDMAEEIKQRFITGDFSSEKSQVIKIGKEGKMERNFDRKEVEEVVKARLEEIFGEVRKKLKSAKYDQRLPEGIILTGGGAKMRDIEVFAKKALEASVKIGIPQGIGGVADAVAKPEFAVAVGLAQIAAEDNLSHDAPVAKKTKSAKKPKKSGNIFKKLFSKF